MLGEFALNPEWAAQMLEMLQNERDGLSASARAIAQGVETEMGSVRERLNRLTSIYVSQDIDRETFIAQQEELLSKKKALQEAIDRSEEGVSRMWLEPFKEWVTTAETLSETAQNGSPHEKKRVAVQVFGSNLFLDSKKARGCAAKPWSFIPENRFLVEMVPRPGFEPGTN